MIIYDKGYQVNDDVMSSAVTKTKGLLLENSSSPDGIPMIFDAADIVKPPLENNAFFVTTHQIVTYRQKPGRCPGVCSVKFNQTSLRITTGNPLNAKVMLTAPRWQFRYPRVVSGQ